MKRPMVVLDYPPAIKSKIKCVVVPNGNIWTNGQIDKSIVLPHEGGVYTVRGNVISSIQDPFPVDAGVHLKEVMNKPFELRKGTTVEPFWPRKWFVLLGASHP